MEEAQLWRFNCYLFCLGLCFRVTHLFNCAYVQACEEWSKYLHAWIRAAGQGTSRAGGDKPSPFPLATAWKELWTSSDHSRIKSWGHWESLTIPSSLKMNEWPSPRAHWPRVRCEARGRHKKLRHPGCHGPLNCSQHWWFDPWWSFEGNFGRNGFQPEIAGLEFWRWKCLVSHLQIHSLALEIQRNPLKGDLAPNFGTEPVQEDEPRCRPIWF